MIGGAAALAPLRSGPSALHWNLRAEACGVTPRIYSVGVSDT